MRKSPIRAEDVEGRKGQSVYPAPFAAVVAGRTKRKLGDVFGLANFGVNLTRLDPGAASALVHSHAAQDEFVYVLEGTATLVFGDEEFELGPGDCMGFKAGTGIAHQISNRSDGIVSYIEIGDRTPGDAAAYPRDDLVARQDPEGKWGFSHKDGTPY